MKKLAILLIVVLVGVLFISSLSSPSAEVQTLGSVVKTLNDLLNRMTQDELAKLERKFTTAEFDSAKRLITQWGNLLRIATEAGNIILER